MPQPKILALAAALAALPFAAQAENAAPVASVKNLNADVRIDIVALKRTENSTLTLQILLVNNSPEDAGITAGNTRLIDLVGRRRYEVGLEMGSGCSAPNGGSKNCWMMFAAPPATTKAINVQFYGSWPLVSAPISE